MYNSPAMADCGVPTRRKARAGARFDRLSPISLFLLPLLSVLPRIQEGPRPLPVLTPVQCDQPRLPGERSVRRFLVPGA